MPGMAPGVNGGPLVSLDLGQTCQRWKMSHNRLSIHGRGQCLHALPWERQGLGWPGNAGEHQAGTRGWHQQWEGTDWIHLVRTFGA